MNRRQFAGSLAALGGIGLAPVVSAIESQYGALHVVCDVRVAEFNPRRLRQQIGDARFYTFDGDVTRLWLDVLSDIWREGRAATAGFTRHTEFFLLSTLAREHGYRIAARDEQAQQVSWLLLPEKNPRV